MIATILPFFVILSFLLAISNCMEVFTFRRNADESVREHFMIALFSLLSVCSFLGPLYFHLNLVWDMLFLFTGTFFMWKTTSAAVDIARS